MGKWPEHGGVGQVREMGREKRWDAYCGRKTGPTRSEGKERGRAGVGCGPEAEKERGSKRNSFLISQTQFSNPNLFQI